MLAVLPILSELNSAVMKCSKRFPTEDSIKELKTEIKNSISELQMSIAIILKPILAVHGIYLEHKFWLSSFKAPQLRQIFVLSPNKSSP